MASGRAEASTAQAGAIEIAYETFGDAADPVVVLVAGMGLQMLSWPEDLCAALADRALRVVRFDNRDAGLSTHLADAPPPRLSAAFRGDFSSAAYTLPDMATDVVALLDALSVERAHVVGQSLGAAIAQSVAARHPDRVASLVSIMSTTGAPGVGAATPAASAVLMGSPGRDRESAIEQAVATYRVIGSPGLPLDEADLRERTGRAFDRAFDPLGNVRQLLALLAAGDRTAELAGIAAPTLVIHGRDDPVVALSGGEAVAAAIPGARLEVIEGMGHDLPRAMWPRVVDLIAAQVAAS
jgi:pimeloyl-ACP methyl ester carboxylesterase